MEIGNQSSYIANIAWDRLVALGGVQSESSAPLHGKHLREPVEIAIRGGRSMTTRREFLDGAVAGAASLAISSTAKSYAQIIGSNNRLNFAVIGLNGRAYALLSSLKANKANARISHVCDVESNILKKFATVTQTEMGEAPATEKGFRNLLALREIDATPTPPPHHHHPPLPTPPPTPDHPTYL